MERELRPKYYAALSYCGIVIEHRSAHLELVKQHSCHICCPCWTTSACIS